MKKMRVLASLLALVLFLFMANPCICTSGRGMVVVFKGNQTLVPYELNNGTITMVNPRAFRIPAFVGGIFKGKEFLMVLCDARYDGFSDWSFIEPAARTSYGDYTKWSDAEIVVKNTRKSATNSVVGDVTAVMKGDKIYLFAPSWDASNTDWALPNGKIGWDPWMIVGNVKDQTRDGKSGVRVQWQKSVSIRSLLPNTIFGANGLQFVGGVGNGVVTKNGTIVFPIQILGQEGKYLASIIYSTDDGSTWNMGKGSTHYYLSEGSVTEWGDGKLLLSVRYNNGVRIIYESDDMGTTWTESSMFSRVWGNQQDRKGVGCQGSIITVPVDGENVLLFSHPLNKLGGYKRDTLQLWMSDGQRIVCVGTISEDGKGERSGYSILAHVGDHLYSAHEINPFGDWNNYDAELEEWDRVIALSPLPDLFESVKNTARAWRQVDTELKTKSVPTKWLVGFLADSRNNNVWEDKYNCVNANVNGATRVEGGFRFDGTQGSGAQWPVQSQGQNQFYIFTKKQFTLAATVTIHSIKRAGDHLLLGASMDAAGTKVFIGLGYTQDKKWYFVDANGVKLPTEVSIELGKEYHVAITFADREVSVYVDGVVMIDRHKVNSRQTSINHFFMGGIGKSSTAKGSVCAVKNVMLFNRVLDQAEIADINNVDNYVNQNKPVVTTEPTDIVVDPKSTSKTEPTVAVENPKSTSTTEPPATLENSKSTSTTEPPARLEYPKSSSTTEPPATLENSKSTSTMEPPATLEYPKSTSKTEPTVAVENPKSTSTTEPPARLENPKSTSTTEPKETKAVDRRSIPNKDGDYESEKSKFVTSTSTTENPSEEDTRVDRAVGYISFTAWICLVNSAIVLAGL